MLTRTKRTLIFFTVCSILLLGISACDLLGPTSQIDSSLDAGDLILLLEDLDNDFEAEDPDDLEDLLEDLVDDLTKAFEGRTDVEPFSYGIPGGFENVFGFAIEIKDPVDWLVFDEAIQDFEDDFIEELLDLVEVEDYDSDDFKLGYGDSAAAYTIEIDDLTADIFTFRRDRFAYIIAHVFVDDHETDADEIAETLDERLLDLYGEDDPRLDENEDLEISRTTDLFRLFWGDTEPDDQAVETEVAVEETAAEEEVPEEPVEEPAEEQAASQATITLMVRFYDTDVPYLLEMIDLFEIQTGIEVILENITSDYEDILNVYIASGELPDIAMIPNLADMQEYAASGVLVPLSGSVVDQLYSNYNPDWIEMGSYQDVPYGVFFQVATRSLVWYPTVAFEDMGYEIPQSWDELNFLENQIISNGSIPWCVGIESGGATGWTASDWIEDIVIRTAGPDLYDQWVNHEIPFTHPAIVEAFELLAEIWFNPQMVYGGTESIPSTNFGEAIVPMFAEPTGCWLHRQGSFISFWLPSEIQDDLENQLGVFAFPSIEAQYGTPLIVTGAQYVAFNDRPEAMAFLEFLTTGEATTPWIEAGGYFFPHWDQDISAYDSILDVEQAILLSNASFLRWDASDQLPPSVRSAFWSEISSWLSGQDLDTTLENIEANWP